MRFLSLSVWVLGVLGALILVATGCANKTEPPTTVNGPCKYRHDLGNVVVHECVFSTGYRCFVTSGGISCHSEWSEK